MNTKQRNSSKNAADETAQKSTWRTVTAVTIIAVLTVGGVAIGIHQLKPNDEPAPIASDSNTTSPAETTTDISVDLVSASDETDATVTDHSEYVEIAIRLSDQYEELLNIFTYGTSYDESDVITFEVYPSEKSLAYVHENEEFDYDTEYQRQLDYYAQNGYGRYCKNTDARFENMDDIESFANAIVSERLFHELFQSKLTDGLSGTAVGSAVDSDSASLFTMYNDQLYVHAYCRTQGNLFDHWVDTPIIITEITENSFAAERAWSDCTLEFEATQEAGTIEYHTYKYLFVLDPTTEEWRIDQQTFN